MKFFAGLRGTNLPETGFFVSNAHNEVLHFSNCNLEGVVGDPTVFGNNVWNVYAWDAGGAEPTPDSWNTAYPGFYPINSLNLNNQNQWNANNSPSSAGSGCQAQLRIYDAAGRELWQVNKYYPAGYNAERVRLDGMSASGVLWYELTMPFGTQTKRMVRFIAWGGIPAFPAQSVRMPETLTVEDGLSQGYVTTIFQDAEAFLWVGTRNGLNRLRRLPVQRFCTRPARPVLHL